MSEPAAEELAPPKERGRLVGAVRGVIRQLAAATYVFVAFALVARHLGRSPVAVFALMLALTFAVAALVARLVDGRLWTSALVGLFVALLAVAVPFVQGDFRGHAGAFAAIESAEALAIVATGLAGAVTGRRWRRRKAD